MYTALEVGDLVGGVKKGARHLDFFNSGADTNAAPGSHIGAGQGAPGGAGPGSNKAGKGTAQNRAAHGQSQTAPGGNGGSNSGGAAAPATHKGTTTPHSGGPPAGAAGGRPPPNFGIPESFAIVGSLGVRKDTAICRKCQQTGHLGFECPKRLADLFHESCPGFDLEGVKIPGSTVWIGDELSAEGKRQWRAYIATHGLKPSPTARTTVDFS